jgi:hypothetical protein
MKLDGLPGEKPIVACKLTNGNCWITTHRLIIEEEKHNPRFDIMEKQAPKIYLLKDLKKAEIKNETLRVQFRGSGKALIQLQQSHTPEQLQEIKGFIEQASEILRVTNTLKR